MGLLQSEGFFQKKTKKSHQTPILAPYSVFRPALPLTIGRTWDRKMLTMRSRQELTSWSNMYFCCSYALRIAEKLDRSLWLRQDRTSVPSLPKRLINSWTSLDNKWSSNFLVSSMSFLPLYFFLVYLTKHERASPRQLLGQILQRIAACSWKHIVYVSIIGLHREWFNTQKYKNPVI